MKKILFVTIIILSNIFAIDANAITMDTQPPDAKNGKAFTPRGDFKVLFVAVRFGEAVDTAIKINHIWQWDKAFPESIYGKKTFYTDYTDFQQPINYNSRDSFNVSRWYYEMSNKKFRLIVDTVSVIIDTVPSRDDAMSIRGHNLAVFDTLSRWHSDSSHPF